MTPCLDGFNDSENSSKWQFKDPNSNVIQNFPSKFNRFIIIDLKSFTPNPSIQIDLTD